MEKFFVLPHLSSLLHSSLPSVHPCRVQSGTNSLSSSVDRIRQCSANFSSSILVPVQWQDFGNRKSRTVHTAISHVLYSLFTQHDSLPLTGSFLLSSIPSSRHDWRPFLHLFHSPSLCVCDRLNFFRIWRNEWFIFGQLNLWAKFIDLLFPSISTLCVRQ